MKFNSTFKDLGEFRSDFSQEEIKNEPMLFNCDVPFAYQNGGPITRNFIDSLPESWRGNIFDLVIDSRVHMLMPGWFSCIPGFHHDDVPRSRDDGQPNYINPEYKSEHLMGLVNGDICPTEFAVGEIDLEIPPLGSIIYREWHKEVESAVTIGKMKSELAKSGRYIEFDWQSFHQGTKAIGNGFRWFIRISRNTSRNQNITNEIRKQVQVYLEAPMDGW